MQNTEFTVGQIHAIDCVKEAWSLIKTDYWLLFAISVVGAMIGGLSMYILIGAMVCGIFNAYLKVIDGGRANIDDLWSGFKYFWPSLGVTIVVVVPILVWMVVLIVTVYAPIITSAVIGNRGDQSVLLGTFVFGMIVDLIVAVIMMFIHSLLIFAFPLIVDRGLSSWDAMKLSARAVLKNLGGIGSLVAVNFGLALAGEMALCVGIYLVIPIITAANIVAYRKVFPRITI
jgi:uncharacterized membrane protein